MSVPASAAVREPSPPLATPQPDPRQTPHSMRAGRRGSNAAVNTAALLALNPHQSIFGEGL